MAIISVAQYQKRLQSVTNKQVLEQMMNEIVLSDQKLKEQKINEFTRGKMPDGSLIGNYQSAEYAIDKYQMNPLADGHVDLMVTRSFVNHLFVDKIRPRAFLFNSSDWKTDRLIRKYTIDIMGLNDDYWRNRQKQVYLPVFKFMIKRKANL